MRYLLKKQSSNPSILLVSKATGVCQVVVVGISVPVSISLKVNLCVKTSQLGVETNKLSVKTNKLSVKTNKLGVKTNKLCVKTNKQIRDISLLKNVPQSQPEHGMMICCHDFEECCC